MYVRMYVIFPIFLFAGVIGQPATAAVLSPPATRSQQLTHGGVARLPHGMEQLPSPSHHSAIPLARPVPQAASPVSITSAHTCTHAHTHTCTCIHTRMDRNTHTHTHTHSSPLK